MLIEIKGESAWNEWDDFIENTPDTSFLAYSFWLESYVRIPVLIQKVGLVIRLDGKVKGGISGLRIGLPLLYFNVFPSGPYFSDDVIEADRKRFLVDFLDSPMIRKSRFSQFSFVGFDDMSHPRLFKGKKLKTVYLNPGFGLVSFEHGLEHYFASLPYRTKRYIKASQTHALKLEVVQDLGQLHLFYDLLKENATKNNYSIRSFGSYIRAWSRSLLAGRSLFYLVSKDGEYKGAAWFIRCGLRYHYIMGASVKSKPRLDVGYFIHWMIINKSFSENISSYNISVGGSKGVEEFKDGFGRSIYRPSFFCYFK